MLVEYTIEEANLVANMLNNAKTQSETAAITASSALEKLIEASKVKEEEE